MLAIRIDGHIAAAERRAVILPRDESRRLPCAVEPNVSRFIVDASARSSILSIPRCCDSVRAWTAATSVLAWRKKAEYAPPVNR